MFRIKNQVIFLAIFVIVDSVRSLEDLPRVEENIIEKTEDILRSMTYTIFSILKLQTKRKTSRIKYLLLFHHYLCSLTLQDYTTLNKIAKLTRVDKKNISNGTQEFITILNDLFGGDTNWLYDEKPVGPNDVENWTYAGKYAQFNYYKTFIRDGKYLTPNDIWIPNKNMTIPQPQHFINQLNDVEYSSLKYDNNLLTLNKNTNSIFDKKLQIINHTKQNDVENWLNTGKGTYSKSVYNRNRLHAKQTNGLFNKEGSDKNWFHDTNDTTYRNNIYAPPNNFDEADIFIEDYIKELEGKLNNSNLIDDIDEEIPQLLFTEENVHVQSKKDSDDWEFWRPSPDLLPSVGRRIFNGETTKIKYYPFMASVQVFDEFTCTGSIIKSDLVITAASCLQLAYNNRLFRENPQFLSVRIGSTFFSVTGEVIPVIEVYFHPGYNPKTLKNNLAVMRLQRKINFWNKNVKKIEIDQEEHRLSEETDGILVLGWGAKTISNKIHGPMQNRLSASILDFFPSHECKEIYGRKLVTRKNFCGGYFSGGSGACNRDVGGPGIVDGVLVGVISFGSPECGDPGVPTVFTKVGFYVDWIEEIMELEVPEREVRTTTVRPQWEQTFPPFTYDHQTKDDHYTINPIGDKTEEPIPVINISNTKLKQELQDSTEKEGNKAFETETEEIDESKDIQDEETIKEHVRESKKEVSKGKKDHYQKSKQFATDVEEKSTTTQITFAYVNTDLGEEHSVDLFTPETTKSGENADDFVKEEQSLKESGELKDNLSMKITEKNSYGQRESGSSEFHTFYQSTSNENETNVMSEEISNEKELNVITTDDKIRVDSLAEILSNEKYKNKIIKEKKANTFVVKKLNIMDKENLQYKEDSLAEILSNEKYNDKIIEKKTNTFGVNKSKKTDTKNLEDKGSVVSNEENLRQLSETTSALDVENTFELNSATSDLKDKNTTKITSGSLNWISDPATIANEALFSDVADTETLQRSTPKRSTTSKSSNIMPESENDFDNLPSLINVTENTSREITSKHLNLKTSSKYLKLLKTNEFSSENKTLVTYNSKKTTQKRKRFKGRGNSKSSFLSPGKQKHFDNKEFFIDGEDEEDTTRKSDSKRIRGTKPSQITSASEERFNKKLFIKDVSEEIQDLEPTKTTISKYSQIENYEELEDKNFKDLDVIEKLTQNSTTKSQIGSITSKSLSKKIYAGMMTKKFRSGYLKITKLSEFLKTDSEKEFHNNYFDVEISKYSQIENNEELGDKNFKDFGVIEKPKSTTKSQIGSVTSKSLSDEIEDDRMTKKFTLGSLKISKLSDFSEIDSANKILNNDFDVEISKYQPIKSRNEEAFNGKHLLVHVSDESFNQNSNFKTLKETKISTSPLIKGTNKKESENERDLSYEPMYPKRIKTTKKWIFNNLLSTQKIDKKMLLASDNKMKSSYENFNIMENKDEQLDTLKFSLEEFSTVAEQNFATKTVNQTKFVTDSKLLNLSRVIFSNKEIEFLKSHLHIKSEDEDQVSSYPKELTLQKTTEQDAQIPVEEDINISKNVKDEKIYNAKNDFFEGFVVSKKNKKKEIGFSDEANRYLI